jgi:hypothetical protein
MNAFKITQSFFPFHLELASRIPRDVATSSVLPDVDGRGSFNAISMISFPFSILDFKAYASCFEMNS